MEGADMCVLGNSVNHYLSDLLKNWNSRE